MKKSGKKVDQARKGVQPGYRTFHDRNMIPINPMKEQFEPTEAEPIRRSLKQAGG